MSIDSQNAENEDDDQFVEEVAPQISEMSEIEIKSAMELEDCEKHGELVKKFLEIRKTMRSCSSHPNLEKRKNSLSLSWHGRRRRVFFPRRSGFSSVHQTFCKILLPLGKIMEYSRKM